jgi:hypothetical protein
MVQVTERAKDALLRRKLSTNLINRDVGLRLTARADGQLELLPDRAKAGDEIVRHMDSTVLLVDPQISALVVTGRTVDCRRTTDGRDELVLRRTGPAGQVPA